MDHDEAQEEKSMWYVGDEWAEDHQEVELADDQGFGKERIAEGLGRVTKVHALVAEHAPAE
ncbi:hypothetical protein [Ornithinimicrobium pekingense]|uniref:Uncharacterized protein n=1 Tax=Ornithinimicrobium pekingense TaxID=384677 RepID=A0ABQ2FG11_9MICO|nr:hypothetical protein [Ornithinimicrobium pekingense]GGK83817.1 hypothetical protein GCM10011509_35430 [Ornithinimicrobium pekingense]